MGAKQAEILLIEDDLGDSDLTREILQKKVEIDSRLTVIEDGAEALRYLFDQVKPKLAKRPDLVILDLNLPKLDGRSLLREIKSDEALRDIPVVVFTTSNAKADVSLSYSLGANAYVSKPHEYLEFESAVGAIRDFWLRVASLQVEPRPALTSCPVTSLAPARSFRMLIVSKDQYPIQAADTIWQKAAEMGLAVTCNEDAASAFQTLERDSFDAILLDADLADSLDIKAIQRLRSLAGSASVITFHRSLMEDPQASISVWQFLLDALKKDPKGVPSPQPHEKLEEVVKMRTHDLLDVNKRLQEAVIARFAAENAARRSEARYHQLANCTFEGIVVHENETIVDCNLAFATFFQYPIGELIGKNLLSLIVDRERSFFTTKLHSDDESPFESRAVRKDGTLMPMEFQSKWLDDEGRKYRITACRDLLEKLASEQLRRRNLALIKANKDLEQFASIASHDLKEPIRSMQNFLQLLKSETHEQLTPTAEKYVDRALKCSARMQNMTNDLLDFSKLAGAEFNLVPVDLQEVLDQALEQLSESIRESEAAVEWDKLPLVQGDRSQLVQLFQNLLGNAIKFRRPEERPHIQIRCKKVDGMWKFTVQDNGIGFEKQQAQNIFVMFQRLHSQDKYPGSGLGLAICFKVIQNHQGRIWADSEPGVGSTFYFTLQAVTSHNLTGKKILVVDDSEDVRLLFGHILTARGARVELAESGAAALAKVEADGGYDVIIMDIEMPGMNGRESTAALRSAGFMKKIIAFTGHKKNWTVSDYRPLGFDGYVCKDNAISTLADYCIKIIHEEVALESRIE